MGASSEHRPSPGTLQRAEHTLSRSAISANALKVLYRLHRTGFVSYLVGGAVRDLLLGRNPKDFDVGTNARPSQVRQLFRNAWVIGRRFRLVLVRFEGEVVEVATFRRSPDPPEMEDGETVDALAPVVDGGEFGTPEEDAWRRDFSVNALFYDIGSFSVIDYVGGLKDLDQGVIRTIGDARQRFAEDPVRMLRAVEYAARLGFSLTPEIEDALADMHGELRRAAPARIAYELLESLKSGSAGAILRGMARYNLLDHVVPEARRGGDAESAHLDSLLEAAEAAHHEAKLHEETLLGLLFLPRYLALLDQPRETPLDGAELEREIKEQLAPACVRLAFSNHRVHILRGAFFLLNRVLGVPRSAKVVARTLRHEAFPVTWQLARVLARAVERYREGVERYDTLRRRIETGQPLDGMLGTTGGGRPTRRRRGRRRRARSKTVSEQETP